MRLFPPQLEIGDTEGFAPDKDIFGRAALGQRLTNLMSLVSDPVVIAVDAQWGSGKTAFLKMWASELRKNGRPVIYFDAFANDYSDDAFAAIAGEIVELAERRRKNQTPKAKQFLATAMSASKVLVRSGLKLGIKAATMGAIEAADLKQVSGDLANEAGALTDKYVGELITQKQKQLNVFQAFRDALADLPALLADSKPGDATSTFPLVVIVDELDRCRPVFALEILERIKHFFSVPNVHFVLGTHLHQLSNSVIVAYGAGVDARTYLQKFIHLTFHLVDDTQYRHEKTTNKFITYLIGSMEFSAEHRETVSTTADLIRYFADRQSLSLRAIERIISVLAIALAFAPRNLFKPPPILAGLCVLKVTAPEIYARAKQGTLRFSDIERIFPFFGAEEEDARKADWLREWWQTATDPNAPQQVIDEIGQSMRQYHFDDRYRIVPFVANNVIDRMVPA
jgi:hypothetical protein